MLEERVGTGGQTRGTFCDGCRALDVLLRRKKRTYRWSYWCNRLHGSVDVLSMNAANCPNGGPIK